ncbi:MAG: hypothetical protein HY617_04005 [Candidatus Sungbacteria bacterium]|nr:hypothetical protein [Candidatus Sungbacteria bacterium]
MQKGLTIFAGLLALISLLFYGYAILYKGKEPVKASWIIWTIVDLGFFFSMYEKHAVNGQIVGGAVGTCIILILALRYGSLAWKPLHTYCLAVSVIGVILWKISHDSLYGIWASLIANSIGCLPTFDSAWQHPEREDKLAWAIGWFGSLCAIAAIPHVTWEDAAQPVSFFITQSTALCVLVIRTHVVQYRILSP